MYAVHCQPSKLSFLGASVRDCAGAAFAVEHSGAPDRQWAVARPRATHKIAKGRDEPCSVSCTPTTTTKAGKVIAMDSTVCLLRAESGGCSNAFAMNAPAD